MIQSRGRDCAGTPLLVERGPLMKLLRLLAVTVLALSFATPVLAQRTPSSAGRPARRDSTVMRSATMKPE